MHRLKVSESYDEAGMLYEVRSPKCKHGVACVSTCHGADQCEYYLCKDDDHHYCTEDEE